MPPEVPLDVWRAKIPWGHADYPRPVVFLGHRSATDLVVVRLSTKTDLMHGEDFLIPASHPDFAATGLPSESYAEARALVLAPEDFIERLGMLEGALRLDFERWLAGVPRD
jgi:hypothetical protein